MPSIPLTPLDPSKNQAILIKDSSGDSFKDVSNDDYSILGYGTVIAKNLSLSASLQIECLEEITQNEVVQYTIVNGLPKPIPLVRRNIYALKNILNNYSYLSPHYQYSSSLGNKEKQHLVLVNIPSIFYGESINKGSVSLEFQVSGTVISKLQDIKNNGELIQTTGSLGLNQVAGVVLYNEGFIILTGSWALDNNHSEVYSSSSITPDNPKWIYWGSGRTDCTNAVASSSFDLDFEGINYINTITMLAHAEKGDLNHSNNPTYIDYGNHENFNPVQTTTTYLENEFLDVKNTTKYPYENYTGSLEKQTFITKIGIYDENKNLIAVAKVSKPIRKTETRDLTFKLKLDI